MGYVNRFSRGVYRVRKELAENGNGEATFDLSLVTSFRVVEKISEKYLEAGFEVEITQENGGTTPIATQEKSPRKAQEKPKKNTKEKSNNSTVNERITLKNTKEKPKKKHQRKKPKKSPRKAQEKHQRKKRQRHCK